MLCGSFSFAVMATLTHALQTEFDWRIIALSRAFLALVFAAFLGFAAGIRFVFARPPTLWVRSLAGSTSLVCSFYCLTHLPVAEVLTVTNVFPIWVALLSWPLYKEPPSLQVWLSVASSIAGVVLIRQQHFAEGSFAMLIALFSSFTTAVAMLGLHHLQDIDARAIVVHFSAVSCLFCLAALLCLEPRPALGAHIPVRASLVLVLVGVAATIGQLFLTKAFAAGPPAKVAVVGLTQVVFGMCFDLVMGQSFEAPSLLGMGLILGPTAWLMLRRARG